MQVDCRRMLISACGCLLVTWSAGNAGAADHAGRSTIRAVSVTRPDHEAATLHSAPSQHAPIRAEFRATRSTASVKRSSSFVIVTGASAEPTPRDWVQQAAYTTTEPAEPAPAEPPSSIVLERVSPDSTQSMKQIATIAPASTASADRAMSVSSQAADQPLAKQPARPLARPAVARPAATVLLPADLPVTHQARQTLDFFGGYSARVTLSQMPRRAPIRPAGTRPDPQRSKPFQSVHHEPTISPYLNLHRNEDDGEAAPNYYSFVQPQMEQLEINRRQQLEIQRLERQLQGRSSAGATPQYGSGATSGVGTAARFMDTAQFYGGMQR